MDKIFLDREHFEQIFQSHLKTETYPKSIETLLSGRFLDKIDYKPYYQRNYVWKKDKASYFIESILLGTEIPPLIFFNNGQKIEVVDGRQRFETIKRFKESQFSLTKKGLSVLKQLAKSSFDSWRKDDETREIIEIFFNAKIRIIEFKIVNEPKLDSLLEDKIKKEIFRRYNSGITPLKQFDIDNAVYVKDGVSNFFKNRLKNDQSFFDTMFQLLFLSDSEKAKDRNEGKILQFIRKNIVLDIFPIKYYARATNKNEIVKQLYSKVVNDADDINSICDGLIRKINLVKKMQDTFTSRSYKFNRFVYECLLWSIKILEREGADIENIFNNENILRLGKTISDNMAKFYENQSHYDTNIIKRYSCTANIFSNLFSINLNIYVDVSDRAKKDLKKIQEEGEVPDTITKLNELESLRITKPDPSRNSIDDIVRRMERHKFLIRPAYQRNEVINLSKASAIIESILLDINLPPIFIFKRADGISEVIDGQQRLLTILGFIGKEYRDQDGNRQFTKNHKFKLKGLNILKDLNKQKFATLPEPLKDKIWDFGLLIVEIEERLNPKFNPVDLFVRLNDKPYPINENSFEMWNSWVDRELISAIRDNVHKHKSWFYIKAEKNADGSRMENEELYTSLAYLEYQSLQKKDIWKYLGVYKQRDEINVRIRRKQEITKTLELSSQNEEDKSIFEKGIKNVEKFISKLKLVLLDKNIDDEKEKYQYFLSELNNLFKAKRDSKTFRRTKQDFYILWCLLSPISQSMVEYKRLEIRQRIKEIFINLRNMVANAGDMHEKEPKTIFDNFHKEFAQSNRKLRLNKSEQNQLIEQQNNLDPITGAPIFIGDEVEVDHIKPIAIGGEDVIDNVQVTHKSSNRSKGAKYN